MRNLLAVALLAALALPVAGQEPDPKEKPAPKLKVGDAAPAIKATKWLQGDKVEEFAPGKVYVVEFWATWCGPCIVMMPHMGEMQREYKDKGVVFIGFSPKDPNNTEEKVAAFVKKRGPKLGYTFAFAEDRETHAAWMQAAGRGGIPCAFVVDKAGKIAYIGHPMYLDVVLPKVVAGTWKIDDDVALLDKIEKDVNAVFAATRNPDAEAGLKAVAEFETTHPLLANIPYFIGPKLGLYLKAKKLDEAKKFAEGVVAKAEKQDDPLALRIVSSALRVPEAKESKELTALALKAAEAALTTGGKDGEKDPQALLNLAETHFFLGDKVKAREAGARAIAAAENESPALKAYIERQTQKFGDEK